MSEVEEHTPISFEGFTIDAASESLWRGSERIHLRPKSFAFLQYLAMHPGQMIAKERLLDILWKDCFVGEGALKHCVAEIRKALEDPAETPRFIETAHRRGYRFIGKISKEAQSANVGQLDPVQLAGSCMVGRTKELAILQQLLGKAIEGSKQVVFVTGEQGIGKTTLVDSFLKLVSAGLPAQNRSMSPAGPLIARGQCIKSHGAREAYMPLSEAFTGLCRETSRKHIVTTLREHAPLWLLQMPSLASPEQLRKLKRATLGATRERMIREMAEALETLTADAPLILVIEDLHWSDYSTLDLILYWAQRRTPARFLLIGTYRPAEAASDDYLGTIVQELIAHGQCRELSLAFLSADAVGEYLM